MERFPKLDPNGADALEIRVDLDILNDDEEGDNSPFVLPVKHTPSPNAVEEHKEKPPKKMTALQKAREKARTKRGKVVKSIETNETLMTTRTEPTVTPHQAPVTSSEDDFEKFIGYMDKYETLKTQRALEQQRKAEAQAQLDKEQEEKYFKKFTEQQQEQQRLKEKAKEFTDIPAKAHDYGEYSHLFI